MGSTAHISVAPSLPEEAHSLPTAMDDALRAVPAELHVCALELRVYAPKPGTSLLLERRSVPQHVDQEPLIDHDALIAGLAHPEPSVLAGLGEDEPTWVLCPLAKGSARFLPHVLIGLRCDPEDLDAAALERIARALAPLTPHARSAARPSHPGSRLGAALIEAVPVPVAIVEASGRLLEANANFRYLFAGGAGLRPGQPLSTQLPGPQSAVFQDALRATLGRRAPVELPLPPLSGELGGLTHTLTCTLVAPALEAEPGAATPAGPLVIFVLREVTAGLQLSHLREANEIKEFLFRTLLHDMKSPLGAIINAVELVQGMLPEQARQDVGELVWAIESSSQRIKQLLDDMHEYFSVRFRKDDVDDRGPVHLGELLDPMIKVYRMQGLPHRFQMVIEASSPVVHANAHRLSRAVDNILSNAAKYAPGGGEIRLHVSGPDAQGRLVLAISDEGPGIPAAFLDKIWDPFYRLRGAESVEGSGLGLSITRHIIESFGGVIHATSRPTCGTTFTLRLPQYRAPQA